MLIYKTCEDAFWLADFSPDSSSFSKRRYRRRDFIGYRADDMSFIIGQDEPCGLP